MKPLLSCLLLLIVAGETAARAETVVVSGVELRLPAEWDRKAKGPITMLMPRKHKGRAIEVIALKAMPPATPDAFKALLGGDKLELAAVKELDREGTKVIAASGKLVAKQGEVAVDVLVVPVKDKAAMLVSFVGADQDPLIKQANVEILGSARIPGPRIAVTYNAPKQAGMVGPPKSVVEGITAIAAVFDKNLRLPRPLQITFEECGMVNARYMNAKHAIQLCHDLYDDYLVLFASAGMDKAKAEEVARNAFVFVFLHELGHALVGELGLPITGSGEDAADEIATLILGQNPKSHKIALAGATWFEVKAKKPGHKHNYWSTHSFDDVRFASILCLLYGSDKAAHAGLMKQYKVPPTKLQKCARDTPLRLAAWKDMLKPYAVKK